jgi:hypothetical protein
MKNVIVFFIVFFTYIVCGTFLSSYLDSKFYGENWKEARLVHANKSKGEQPFNPDTQTVMGPNGKEYTVKIIAYIPKIDDEPKIIRAHDPEFDVYCYTNQNDPYYITTGLNCFPKWMLEGNNRK